jgi:hypothetical protein
MALHFPREHSHRWAEHVKAWSDYLGEPPYDKRRIKDVCFNRDELPTDEYRNNYTPLMTSLLYGLFMKEKMEMGTEFLRNLFDDEPSEMKIRKETKGIMGYFFLRMPAPAIMKRIAPIKPPKPKKIPNTPAVRIYFAASLLFLLRKKAPSIPVIERMICTISRNEKPRPYNDITKYTRSMVKRLQKPPKKPSNLAVPYSIISIYNSPQV